MIPVNGPLKRKAPGGGCSPGGLLTPEGGCEPKVTEAEGQQQGLRSERVIRHLVNGLPPGFRWEVEPLWGLWGGQRHPPDGVRVRVWSDFGDESGRMCFSWADLIERFMNSKRAFDKEVDELNRKRGFWRDLERVTGY